MPQEVDAQEWPLQPLPKHQYLPLIQKKQDDILPDVEGCDNEVEEDAWIVSQTRTACPFCYTDFINQEEVIEHMEICLGTDPEHEVLKLICLYCQKTFEKYHKILKHIGIHIIR